MLQNKIYQNYFIEIIKTFLTIVLGLSLIALTVRAVNFLELIVDNGYPVTTYFQYSMLNIFGIAPKFMPLAFFISVIIFIIKHQGDSEFIILWTSGVKKLQLVNLILFSSITVLIIYLVFSAFLTPLALNKSRQLLTKDQLNSFLPTIKAQKFSDSFKGFTFFVEKKINNEIKNIFLYDKANNLKGLSSNSEDTTETTIVAESGLIDKKKMFLFNGQIISSKKNNENEIIKFSQLNIDLTSLNSTTIKKPKIQETSTLKLLSCFTFRSDKDKLCNKSFLKEVISTLNRRIIIPIYIPVISLICSLLLIRSNKIYFSKTLIFIYSFVVLLFTELAVRYTGINSIILISFILLPFLLLFFFYTFLIYKFSHETNIK